MPYTDTGKANMLLALGATHVAAFSGDPTGAGVELDRVAITWAAPAAGAREQAADPELAIGAGETVDHVGYFDAATAGNLLMYDPVTAETFASAGTYTLTSSAHSLNAA